MLGVFLVVHMKVKHSLEFLPMLVLFHHQGKKQYTIQSDHVFFSLETYTYMSLSLEGRAYPHISALTECLTHKMERPRPPNGN